MKPPAIIPGEKRSPATIAANLVMLLFLVFLINPAQAEQTLADADWSERELGSGVMWRQYMFDDLFGSQQTISYIEVDLTNPDVEIEFPYLATTRQKTSTMVPAQFPSSKAAINGTYFETGGTGGHVTYLRIDGTEIPPGGDLFSPWGYEGALRLNASNVASIGKKPAAGWSANVNHPNIMACGPIVLFNGVVPDDDLSAIGAHCTSRHPRSVVGITNDSRLILLTVDGRTDMSAGMTCEEIGLVMDQLGCDDALNLDGGGSTTLWGAGEPYNGVLNFPTDNGAYDHLGERACSNAISIVSTSAAPAEWDARLVTKTFSSFMETGTAQVVTLAYKNIGTGTWTSADTQLVLARPDSRTSVFYNSSTWHSTSQPALMTPASVAPGETGTFTFTLQSPVIATSAVYDEHFKLVHTGTGRIGPADSEAWMRVGVQAPIQPEATFIVESRMGGMNAGWYSDSGMADTTTDCEATGCTPGIGMRYGSTFRSVAGSKQATVAPDFPAGGFYNVYVAWGGGGSRRSPVTYHVIQPGLTHTTQLDQSVTSNTWVQLGTAPFYFEKGLSGSVVMTNEDIDISGNMYAGAVKFEYVPAETAEQSYEVVYLGTGATTPVINGIVSPGEWDAASPAASDFVQHNNPSSPAAEDGSFQMLFDDTHLYLLFQMNNAHLPSFAVPSNPYGYANLGSDKINFFLTPFGPSSQRFYRLVFSPNPTNGTCYVWSQASLVKTTSATEGTDWNQRGGAAYSYAGNVLTIEYSIPWSEFDYQDIDVSTCPEDGTIWGVQPSISNQLTVSTAESVNWEPDDTASYVLGEPFGELVFVKGVSEVADWSLY